MAKTTRRVKPFTAFQSIVVSTAPGHPFDESADDGLGDVFDRRNWEFSRLWEGRDTFEVKPTARLRRTVRDPILFAWEKVYELRADPRVASAEPLFALSFGDAFTGGCYNQDPSTKNNFEWSLDAMCVKQAWQLFTSGHPGAGITVGHPDTGFTDHGEILGPRLLVAEGHNFEEPSHPNDPHDTLAHGGTRVPGHGTRTASVIMSGEGPDASAPAGDPFVSGVAPFASLIPIRTTKVAAIFNPSHLIQAINFAAALADVQVISISLGGPFNPDALHQAVKNATDKGIIVLCGAGNKFGPILTVSYPAASDEVIAVAASNFDETPWSCSCRGPAVDITAPGHSVWSARTEKKGSSIEFTVDRDSGTSFATAGVAGIAALWLSFHGLTTLASKYGLAGIPAVFKQLLLQSCKVPPGWPTDKFGAGIANARKLLKMPLPAVAPSWITANGLRKPPSIGNNTLETLVHLAYPAPRSGVAWTMARVLRVDEPMLPAALHVVGDEIVFSVARSVRLRASLQAAADAAVAQGGPRKRTRTREQWATTIRRQLAGKSASRQLRQALTPPVRRVTPRDAPPRRGRSDRKRDRAR